MNHLPACGEQDRTFRGVELLQHRRRGPYHLPQGVCRPRSNRSTHERGRPVFDSCIGIIHRCKARAQDRGGWKDLMSQQRIPSALVGGLGERIESNRYGRAQVLPGRWTDYAFQGGL